MKPKDNTHIFTQIIVYIFPFISTCISAFASYTLGPHGTLISEKSPLYSVKSMNTVTILKICPQ